MSDVGIKRKDVFRYVLLPGFRPRFAELFGKGFHYIPYFIALVYQCVRLLPDNHPYLNAQNIGRFGIRHVVAEAANNLVISRKNIDQIILFGLVLLALVIVFMQIFLMIFALFVQPSMSFPTNFAQFFITGSIASAVAGSVEQDIAYILLDMTFGVPGMFNSCVAVAAPCLDGNGNAITIPTELTPIGGLNFEDFTTWPYPIHDGLHQLFAVYSYGLLIVAVMMITYFIFTIIAETAQTGTAFGKRFNKVWAPIRLVAAIGLLVPLTYGMNSAQYITLYAAKFGSGFASNGWAYFNSTLTSHYEAGVRRMVATPNFPESGVLLQFFNVAAVCKHAYTAGLSWNYNAASASSEEIMPFLVREPLATPAAIAIVPPGAPGNNLSGIGGDAAVNAAMPYHGGGGAGSGFIDFANGSNRVVVRFGDYSPAKYPRYLGNVKPFCGEIVFNLEDSGLTPADQEDGAEIIQRFYWWLVKALWFTDGKLDAIASGDKIAEYYAYNAIPGLTVPTGARPIETADKNALVNAMTTYFDDVLSGAGGPDDGGLGTNAIDAQIASGKWNIDPEVLKKGWAGAAIWYNKIAEMNGAVTSAIFNIPLPSLYPYLMEYTKEKKIQMNQDVEFQDRYDPSIGGRDLVPYATSKDREFSKAMNEMFQAWEIDGAATSTATQPTGNIIIDTINVLLGTDGLFEMRKNNDVHPLAQLVGVGRALVESSIRNLGYAALGGATGAVLNNFAGDLGGTAASFMITIAMVGLTAGFILFYIVPFLPFIYFFFAVGGWVKGIFEAMVGVPLWALAHIRIDGNGLPGQAAVNGYFLIFEIFLRPILIIFGFLASIMIFSAMVDVLHDIYNLVVANVGGYDMREELTGSSPSNSRFYRSAIDQFFYTIVYAIIVYMMAQSSFKLIDLIPNNILRWMGSSVATFNDQRQDPAEGLVGTAQIGAQQSLSGLGQGVGGIVDAATARRG